jgi:hypothetical protein
VGATGAIIENAKEDQVATKIPFRGDIKDPKANIWYTITHVLQNAFIRAIQPSIDNEINLAAVDDQTDKKKGFFGRIFTGSDKKKDEKEKDDKSKEEAKNDDKKSDDKKDEKKDKG